MPVTIQEAVQRLEKELLLYSEKTRDKLSRTMVVRLNAMMDATAIESVGMQMKWDVCSFCPKDALSLFTKPKSSNAGWSEETAILFIWDKEGKNISGFEVMNNVKNRFVTCPGCIRRVIVPTVKFKGCPA